jgi:tetratricopeptide (TPR) repeat protein
MVYKQLQIFSLTVLLSAVALATPRVPIDTNEVLAMLSPRPSLARDFRASKPADAQHAQEEIQALLQQAQRDDDPRYLGYAEAQLATWVARPDVPPQIRLLHARLLQAGHRFDEAQHELQQVLQADPHNQQALLLKASIHQVRAQYARAGQACRELRGAETLLLSMICSAQVDGMSGHGEAAYARMSRLATQASQLLPDQQAWFYLGLGDLASRLGYNSDAGAAYQQVHAHSPATLAAWADWLLDNNRPSEVVALLQDKRQNDGLLLRLARAQLLLANGLADSDRGELETRFAALRRRGEQTHLREEALFALQVQGDPQRALELARANWQQQREPADARIYRDAAHASGNQTDLRVVDMWRLQSGLEDVRLASASGALAAGPNTP